MQQHDPVRGRGPAAAEPLSRSSRISPPRLPQAWATVAEHPHPRCPMSCSPGCAWRCPVADVAVAEFVAGVR
jgi:hypothetical protein